MLPHSEEFHHAMLMGAPVIARAWVQRKGSHLFGPEGLTLSDAVIELDEFAAQRRTLSARIADPDGILRPTLATDAFAPFGNELVVQAGFELSNGPEYVQLGIFRIEVAEGGADGFVHLTGYDRSKVIELALDEQPHVIVSGTSLSDAIHDWADEKYPGIEFFADPAAADTTIDTTLVYEDGDSSGNPWDNMRKLALLFGREVFIDWRGAQILRPVPASPTPPTSLVYAAIYEPGEYNLAISVASRLAPGDLRNVVRIIGAGSALSESIVSVAEVDDPSDPLYAGPTGAFGRRPVTIRSPAVTTQEQADVASAATLIQRTGASENVILTLAPVLVHEPGDIVAFRSDRQRVTEVLALSRWPLNIGLQQPMTVSTRLLRETP